MSAEENKVLVRRFIDAANQNNLAVFDVHFAPDFVSRDTVVPVPPGPEGVRQLFAAVRSAFPDFHETIEDLVAEDDKVVARWTTRGTHQGEFAGIPPTGKSVTWKGMFIVRVADGKIVEVWQAHGQLPSFGPNRGGTDLAGRRGATGGHLPAHLSSA